MNKVLSTSTIYRRPFPILLPVIRTNVPCFFSKPNKPLPQTPPTTPPPPPLFNFKTNKTNYYKNSNTPEIKTSIPCSLTHLKLQKPCLCPRNIAVLSSNAHQEQLTPPQQPDWELIRTINKLPKHPRPPTNACVAFEWINGTPHPYIISKINGVPLNHQFKFVFQQMLRKSRLNAILNIQTKINAIIQVAIEKDYIIPLIHAAKLAPVTFVPNIINPWDVVYDAENCLQNSSSKKDNPEFLALIIIKQGIMNYWLQLGSNDVIQQWDSTINNATKIALNMIIQDISLQASAIRDSIKETFKKTQQNNVDDAIDSWNTYVMLKNKLMDLNKRKEITQQIIFHFN